MRMRSIALVSILLFTAALAFGASVHFKPKSPVFYDQGVVLLAEGTLAGLGNEDLTIVLTATASVDATCTNRGGNQAPGQNPADVTISGTQNVPAEEVQNGEFFFSVTTQVPPRPTPEAAGCPSGNWTATIVDLHFLTATITVLQGGVTVLQETFTL